MSKRYIVRKSQSIYAVAPWSVYDTREQRIQSYWDTRKGAREYAGYLNERDDEREDAAP